MKLNGKSNVITDVDITLTNTKHIGESLHSVIEETDERLDKLESNIKWVYENGGVGSGSGGGGGSSTKWYIRATLGGIALESNSTVPLSNGAGTYTLRLYTSGGSGDYSVSYTVGKNLTRTVKLNADNGWTTNIQLDLQENGIIEIIAKDGVITREITGVSYVVIPYAFGVPALYRRDGSQYASSSGDIGVNIAQRNGIILKAPYIIATPAQTCEYKWYQNGIEIQDAGGTISDASGDIIYEIPRSLIENDNAGLYTYQLVVSLLPVGAVEPVIISNSCSFNLIPETLYLKISPANSDEVIYTSDDIDNPYYFATNTKIALNVRIYKGLSSQNLSGRIWWEVNGEDPESYDGNGSLNVTDGYTYKITTHFLNPGVNKVTFYYELYGETGTPIEKYFYCKEVSTSYNWFFQTDTSNNNPEVRRYYIPSETSGIPKLYGIIGVSESALYIEKKKSDESNTTLTVLENYDDGQYTGYNQMFNFGIQYNDINNTSNPLITCYDKTGNEAIIIYQNKITFKGQFFQSESDCNVFFHKEVNYDPENPKKYHLLTINVAVCYYEENYHYEITVYLDGKMEGTVDTKALASATITNVELHNANFALNHFEVSSWGESDIRRVYDIDVNWYYNSYSDRIGLSIDSEETEILTQMFDTSGAQSKPNYNMNNRLIKVDAGMPENIAGKIDVPIMVITCNKDIVYQGAKPDIFTWMNTSYADGQVELNSVTLDVQKLEWCPGINKSLKEIEIKDENEKVLGNFTLDLQGSSTMTNKAKNFTLAIKPSESIASQNKAVLFSPNFVSDEASTFLPERAFTLKADDVDSSHSNNTAVGKFVNENNNWNYRNMIDLIGVEDTIKSHIKQCLEGFSMLLFLQVKYQLNDVDYNDYYYLGIYNFNLGRNSYFNLGYADLKQLNSVELDESALDHNGFALCVASVEPVAGFVAAEIQDNSPYWDFSQYDPSILFPLPSSNENSGFMFGDFVYAPNTENVAKATIQNLVKNVAGAGGYLFNSIGKVPVLCEELLPSENPEEQKNHRAYHDAIVTHDPVTDKDIITTYVSDVTQQYIRTKDGTKEHYTAYPSSEIDVTSVGNLIQCVIDDSENDYKAPLDYPSLVYYYTTCMTLGLVDSVEKNLNIKTWSAAPNGNNSKCGLFFYDMDTALGKDNSGAKTDYFAFSDYWKSNITRYDSSGNIIPEDDTITEAARVVNNGITNFRDTFLFGSGVKGYDTPSSFLFAIAKYAYAANSEVQSNFNLIFPQQIYAQWRALNGPLSSADSFIEKYFASNLQNIPGFLINLNYRNKYLYDYDEQNIGFDHAKRLHGIGVEETRDWLRGRLRILDAYFNVNKVDISITPTIWEPKNTVTLSDNPDVYLFSDIFSNGTTGIPRNQDMRFTVTAPDYSPLVARSASKYIWYIFEDSNTAYETYVPSDGTSVIILGGSQLWRTLNSIDSFVISKTDPNSSFIFDSNIIEHMIGSSGTQTGNWVVNGPSLEEISLTSSNYSGTLALNNSFYSLNSVNISNSKISLSARECPIKTVIARNVKGNANIEIVNCSYLQNVDLTGATLQKCEIRPAWTDNINFSNVYAKNVILESKTPGTFTAKSNASLTDVTLTNFENINIDNCSNLKSVQCNDESAVVKKMTIKSCPSLTKLVLTADNLEELNLSGCTALKEITLNGTSFDNLRILGLGNTQVEKMTIGGTVYDNGNLDLTMFPLLSKSLTGLSYVSFYSNKNIVSIKFNNDSDTYLKYDTNISSTNGPFYNCTNLERIYGSFIIVCNSCFSGCNKFSIHGTDLTQVTWKGQSVLNGQKVKHPLDFSGIRTINDYWPRTANITNMRFGGNFASYAFYETNCTIFDIYYMLFGCNNLLTSLSWTFAYPKNSAYGRFNWTSSADNSPDKRMFNNCSNVQSMAWTFYMGSGRIRLFSPTTTAIVSTDLYAREVTANDGLFSSLINLQSYDRVFYGYTMYIDRFVWQRSQLSTYDKLKTINGFSAQCIVNQNVNTLNYNNRDGLSYSEYGNLTDFFKCVPKLSGAIYGLFNTTKTIDYDTVSGIPDGVTTLWRCFRSTGGRGTIDLNRMFSSSSNLTSILHSFIAAGSSTTTVESPLLELTDNTFANLTKLTRIGYSDDNANYPSDSALTTRYSFSGIVRKSYENEFPFDIFANHPDLTMACGVFMNATGSVPNLQLPGRLFENNSKLEECSALFYNLNNGANKYSISETHPISYTKDSGNATKIVAVIDPSSGSPNFTNCPNLRRVDYMFASPSGDTFPQLTGMIPRNLFWHGLDVASKIVTIRGTNTRILHDEDTTYYEYIEEDPIEQWQIVPSATITDINNCFQHCDCSPYINTNPEYEKNPNYSPFLYVYKNKRWKENTKRDTFENTYIWSYDGYNDYSNVWSNSEVLDFVDWSRENIFEARTASYSEEHDVLPSAQRTFICSPDLLRFCTKSARIQGLFAYSGATGMNTTWHNKSLYNYGGKYAFGLKGRICPYLLKPVSDTVNVSSMFAYCKCLSYIRDYENNVDCMLPETFFSYTKNVSNLRSLFSHTIQPHLITLRNCFKPLIQPLELNNIFYRCYWSGSDTSKTLISEVFRTNQLKSVVEAFAMSDSNQDGYPRSQFITFENIFPSSYAVARYASDSNFSKAFFGYTSSSYVTHEDPKTLPDNIETRNYTYIY